MSLYNERYDDALSKAPWVSKTSNGRTYLFKYASHPDRAGYLFVVTDLETVHFEELSATSVPTRLGHIAALEGGTDDTAGMGMSAQQARTEEAMRSLASAFEHDWKGATIERDVDDYFDAVFILKAGPFKWLFQMTELRGRQPLSFVAKQLLSPFAALLAEDRGVSIGRGPPVEAVGAIVSDAGVTRALRRVTGAGPPRPTPTPGPPTRHSSPAIPSEAPPTSSPARTPRRALSPERTPLPPPPSHVRAGAAALSLIPPSSPTPIARRRVLEHDIKEELPSSEPDYDLRTSETRLNSGPSDNLRQSSSRSPQRSEIKSSPPPSAQVPSSDAHFTSDSTTTSNLPPSTMDPLINTLDDEPKTKKKKKRKDAKKIEEEEEAEANKRREEMKRRMAQGASVGRLGRKRA